MSNKKDNSGRPITAMWIIMIGFIILFLIVSLLGCKAQEPDLQGYSIEAWEQNNAQWQNKLDSVAMVQGQNCDSIAQVAENWKRAYEFVRDTTIRIGDQYFEIHDTVTGTFSTFKTRGDELWVSQHTDSLRYHFWFLNREAGNKHIEFWIGDGNGASQIMRMDTSQFRIDYQDLNKYFD